MDLEVVEGQRPINQDGEVIPILWMGNLTLSNPKLQAVILTQQGPCPNRGPALTEGEARWTSQASI